MPKIRRRSSRSRPINRRNVFFPLEKPVELEAGDQIDIEMFILPAELIFRWTVNVWGRSEDSKDRLKKASFHHSTFQGMLLSAESFLRTRPQFVPRLSSLGEARRSILELCDGKKPLAEIESEVYRRHVGLFRSYKQAAAFVAEVTTRYSI